MVGFLVYFSLRKHNQIYGNFLSNHKNKNIYIYIFLGIFKKNKNFGFPYCSSCEDLSIDVAINYYCRTDIDEARVISALQHKSKFNIDVS